ncbi:MAG: hypothetical protein US70_C0014G0009 [Parcubacteria group bacterium GW2011_GWD2_38_11]|nr:MAG: hypothetical protein US70_C0014G0009 [Parcubacteria group bacterium GW2011_GWD2_38_11]
MQHVYFLKSKKNKKIYTGSTEKSPAIRLKEYNEGSNKWTRENGPFDLVYYEKYTCEEDAQAREAFYKTGFGRIIRNAILETIEKINKSRDL